MKPIVREFADEYQYIWPELNVAVIFTRLRETESGAVRGTIRIRSTLPEVARNGGGRIFWNIISLTTAADRKTVVGKLDKAAPRENGGWELDVDRCFEDLYERFTQVPPSDDLADVEVLSLETQYLFNPILPDGQITLLLADQGSTKSYLMLYLALCCVLGIDSVFGTPRRQGPALFFDWEVDAQVARRRLGLLCRGLGVEVPHGLHYVNMCERGRLLDRARDMRYEITRVKPSLIAVDSLTFATGGDLNSAEYAAPTMSAIGSLGDGVAKLVSAHPSKSSRGPGVRAEDISVIGSGLFEFRARAIWHMKREASRTSSFGVTLTSRKPFDGSPPRTLGYRMEFDNGNKATRFKPLRLDEVPEIVTDVTMSLAMRIRALLRKAGPLSTNDIAEKLGLGMSMDALTKVRVECNRSHDIVVDTAGGGRNNPTVWRLEEDADEGPGDVPWWSGDKS